MFIFKNYFSVYVLICYNTRYSSKQSLHKKRVRTNYGKQITSFAFIDLWKLERPS